MRLTIDGSGTSAIIALSDKEPKNIINEIKSSYFNIFSLDTPESFIAIDKNFFHLKNEDKAEIFTGPGINVKYLTAYQNRICEVFNIPLIFYFSFFKTSKNLVLLEEEVSGVLGYIDIPDDYGRLIPCYTQGEESILDREFLFGFLIDGGVVPIQYTSGNLITNSTKRYLNINETIFMDV